MAWSKERFEKEMKKLDPMLRIRRSVLEPWFFLIERKVARESKCIPKPSDRRSVDEWIRDKDGYVSVMKVHHTNLNRLAVEKLKHNDMWEYGGAARFADALEEQERIESLKLEKQQGDIIKCVSEEAYDRQMIKQGSVVSGFYPKEAK